MLDKFGRRGPGDRNRVLHNRRDFAGFGKPGVAVKIDGRVMGEDINREQDVVGGCIYDNAVRIPKLQRILHLFCSTYIKPADGPLQSAGFSVKTFDFRGRRVCARSVEVCDCPVHGPYCIEVDTQMQVVIVSKRMVEGWRLCYNANSIQITIAVRKGCQI